jgi:putative membrane protein
MAWIRTSVSMISFGFTIYKFFQFELQGQRANENSLIGPRGFALMMIAIGLLALAVATIQDRRSMRALRTEDSKAGISLATVVAWLFSVLGFIALVVVGFGW